MPGENEALENELLKDITGHEEEGALDVDNAQDDDEAAPPEDKDSRGDDKDDNGDDDQPDDEDDGLGDERQNRQQDRDDKRADPKDETKPDTTVVTADIYDPKTKFKEVNGSLFLNGKQIARAGRERRNFDLAREVVAKERKANVRLVGRLTDLADAARELTTKYTMLENNKNMFEKADLSFDEQKLMFDVAVEYKKNPLNGIKLMLTKAKLAGVDIAQLGVNGGGIDVSTIAKEITSHIDERLKPVNDRAKQDADQAELAKQVNGFFIRNPEAEEFAEKLKGGVQALAGILAKARQTDIDNDREPRTIDEYWQQLHYEILKRGGGTRVVPKQNGKDKDDERNNSRRPRHEKRKYNGTETYADIGRDVLADIRNLNN